MYKWVSPFTNPTKPIPNLPKPLGLVCIVLLPNLTQFCDCTMESLPNLPDAAQIANGTRNGH